MTITKFTKTMWRTSDDNEFDDEAKARQHQSILDIEKALRDLSDYSLSELGWSDVAELLVEHKKTFIGLLSEGPVQ